MYLKVGYETDMFICCDCALNSLSRPVKVFICCDCVLNSLSRPVKVFICCDCALNSLPRPVKVFICCDCVLNSLSRPVKVCLLLSIVSPLCSIVSTPTRNRLFAMDEISCTVPSLRFAVFYAPFTEWVSELSLTSNLADNSSFWRRVFPGNQLHWYWQV